jgi:two-component system cell cycle sensor histidine kinase/response regulator CckA
MSRRLSKKTDPIAPQESSHALNESREHFRELADLLPQLVFEMDINGRLTYSNQHGFVSTGYSHEDMERGISVLSLVASQDRARARQNIESVLAGEQGSGHEYLFVRKDGSSYPVLIYSKAILRGGKPAGVRGIAVEISELKDAERRLRESEERYRLIIENIPTCIWSSDQEGRTIFISSNVKGIYGFTAEEVYLGGEEIWFGRLHPEDSERVKLNYRLLFSEGKDFDQQYRIRRKDGRWIWIHDRARTTAEVSGRIFAFGLFSDITERKRMEEEKMLLEEQLRQAQKMEAIGTLAGGIAHDFNNILTLILGLSDLLLLNMPASDDMRGDVSQIKKMAERAASLTQQLLAFGRKQMLKRTVVDINAVISEITAMLRRLIGEDITLATNLDPELGRVEGDPGQIHQVILNLAVNARDAMAEGGRLTISTRNVDLDEGYARSHIGVNPGRYAAISVSDTGTGMDDNTRSRIFEPFFTTKELGKGTGLGLSTVYGIVAQSGGHIEVESERGSGSTFRVYLPALELEAQADHPAEPALRTPGRGERVLVVEDEPLVRQLIVRVLEEEGYRVSEAENGIDALRTVGEHGQEPIDLLVTDIVMPLMSGPLLAEQLTERYPECRVLFVSGYTAEVPMDGKKREGGSKLLQKPFTRESLARTVREVLDIG